MLEQGEAFGYTSLITEKATLDVVVDENPGGLPGPGEAFTHLLCDARFAGHFTVGLSERLQAGLEHSPDGHLPARPVHGGGAAAAPGGGLGRRARHHRAGRPG